MIEKMPVPFTDDHFKDKIPYYHMYWRSISGQTEPNYYDPISGTYFRKDNSNNPECQNMEAYIDERPVHKRPVHNLTKLYDVAKDENSDTQIYFVDSWNGYVIFRFFSIPIVFDKRKPFPIFDGYRETMRVYLTDEGTFFETYEKMERFNFCHKMRNRMNRYRFKPLFQESLNDYESIEQYEQDIEKTLKTSFPDLFWIMKDSLYQEAQSHDRDNSKINRLLNNEQNVIQPFLKYERTLGKEQVYIEETSVPNNILIFDSLCYYDYFWENNIHYTKIAVLERKGNDCRIHYVKKMPDIFGDNVFHEYAMDCFDQKGKESSYLHLLNGKWIETKQLFFKYDEEVYMSDMMIINKKTTDLKEECLKDTFLEKFLLTKVDPCIRIKYIFAAKHNRFWEQAVKCGFDSWVHGQLGGRRYFFNPKFIKNRNFTEYFTLKEWKENIDIIELDNMEKIYSLKNTGFTITAAHELIREAGFFLKAYEESGYAKGFVGLMNTLVKRSDNSKSEYNDYLHMRKTLPEILRHPEKLLHDYPIVIPGKKIHLYHQRLVNTLEYLELEKQREAIKGYEKKV